MNRPRTKDLDLKTYSVHQSEVGDTNSTHTVVKKSFL